VTALLDFFSHSKRFPASSRNKLRPEIAKDETLMQYAVKGSDDQWTQMLESNELNESGTVQIRSVREKRKMEEGDVEKEAEAERTLKKIKGSTQKKKEATKGSTQKKKKGRKSN
jgi:hypothetical protein